MINFDNNLLLFINRDLYNPVLYYFMNAFTEAGSGEFIAGLALTLLIFLRKDKKITGILLFAGLTVDYYIVKFLKELFARPRPFIVYPDVVSLLHEKGYSFPSGHAMIAFMTAVVLSTMFRKKAPLFFGLAFLVAFSRVYLGAHFPLDVIAGAIIGSIVGWGIVAVSKAAKLV